MHDDGSTLEATLVPSAVTLHSSSPLCDVARLVASLAASGCGLLLLKWSQAHGGMSALVLGYLLEGVAFAAYPLNLRAFSMVFVVVAWSASSALFAVVGGALLFHTPPTAASVSGCVLSVVGTVLVAW